LKKNLLICETVTKDYTDGNGLSQAIKKVSFTIAKGEFTVILGPTGSGKSTLLNLMSGLDIPTSGRVIFDGAPISNYKQHQLTDLRRVKIGFIFENFNLIPSLTVRENIEVVTELIKFPTNLEQILSGVGLLERSEHFPGQLSKGEQQRVALARAVAKNPLMICCDEPTGGLDYKEGLIILKLLKVINQATEKNIVIATDNQALAMVADQIIKLQSGEVLEIVENQPPINLDEIVW